MFKNILYNPPHLITDFEIEFMNKRRQMEISMIGDKFEEEKRRSLDDSWGEYMVDKEKYFIISCEWLQKWKSWVENKDPSLTVLGSLPPGPICNNQLYIGFSS